MNQNYILFFSQFGRLDDQTLDLNLDMGGRGVSHLIPSRVSLIWTSDTRLHFSESWKFFWMRSKLKYQFRIISPNYFPKVWIFRWFSVIFYGFSIFIFFISLLGAKIWKYKNAKTEWSQLICDLVRFGILD